MQMQNHLHWLIFKAPKCTKSNFFRGSVPDPAGSLQCSPGPRVECVFFGFAAPLLKNHTPRTRPFEPCLSPPLVKADHFNHWRDHTFSCERACVLRVQRDCPNGQLTRDKFLEVYSSFFPQGNADKFCEHVFRTFDSDNSGKIDFKEFLQAINITSSGKPEQKLEWAFQMYDVNGDGTIEPSEMAEIIGVRYPLSTLLCT